jgi:IMP dehydrogenase
MTPKERLITVPEGTTLDEAEKVMKQQAIEKVPVLNSDGRVVGIFTRKDAQMKRMYPNAARDSKGRLLVGAAIGLKDKDHEKERALQLIDAGVDVLVLDVAHGDHTMTKEMLKELKVKENISVPIIAGNIATKSAAENLIDWDVDGLKVGIGPGSACDTRVVAGVGIPQITAISDVAMVADDYGIPVMGDGGIREAGDLGKGVVAGADSYMIGGLFAGTDESPGEIIEKADGSLVKRYHGNASRAAYERKQLSLNQHVEETFTAEGREKEVPYRGSVLKNLSRLTGGLRSTMSYVNAHTLDEVKQNGIFVRATPAGSREQLRESGE